MEPMPVSQPVEILDLRHFNARQLRPLLEEQAELWYNRLRWDYRSSTELLLQYLDSRILPGYVALDRGKVCGYSFCVYEGHKAVIGDLYASRANQAPIAVVHTLARHMVETVSHSPGMMRLEAQLLLFDAGQLAPAFAGFRVFPRLFLEKTLDREVLPANPRFPDDLELVRWSPALYEPAGELILRCYQGHIDSEINDQYKTLEGSLRFLHNVVRFPGCGAFDPDCSAVLRDRATHAQVAVLLCSRVAPEVAHITQLCLLPAYRGRGLGEGLFDSVVRQLPGRGYRALTLTVTEANFPALRLYQQAGFTARQRFDALVLDLRR
jgi:ribosomal protein S18 acetylase RimI-like enzyme